MNQFEINIPLLQQLIEISRLATPVVWGSPEMTAMRKDLAQHIAQEELLERQATELSNLFINDLENEDESDVIADIRDKVDEVMADEANDINADSPHSQMRLLIVSMGYDEAKAFVEKTVKDNEE